VVPSTATSARQPLCAEAFGADVGALGEHEREADVLDLLDAARTRQRGGRGTSPGARLRDARVALVAAEPSTRRGSPVASSTSMTEARRDCSVAGVMFATS